MVPGPAVFTLRDQGRRRPSPSSLERGPFLGFRGHSPATPRDQGSDALDVRQALELLLRIEGRIQEARELIVDSWQGAPDPAYVLRRLYILEDAAFPLDYVKRSLAAGDRQDDRVWLGKANLAIWTGQFDEAARWLDACEQRRRDDQPVWLARLAWAMASRDADAAGEPSFVCSRGGSCRSRCSAPCLAGLVRPGPADRTKVLEGSRDRGAWQRQRLGAAGRARGGRWKPSRGPVVPSQANRGDGSPRRYTKLIMSDDPEPVHRRARATWPSNSDGESKPAAGR